MSARPRARNSNPGGPAGRDMEEHLVFADPTSASDGPCPAGACAVDQFALSLHGPAVIVDCAVPELTPAVARLFEPFHAALFGRGLPITGAIRPYDDDVTGHLSANAPARAVVPLGQGRTAGAVRGRRPVLARGRAVGLGGDRPGGAILAELGAPHAAAGPDPLRRGGGRVAAGATPPRRRGPPRPGRLGRPRGVVRAAPVPVFAGAGTHDAAGSRLAGDRPAVDRRARGRRAGWRCCTCPGGWSGPSPRACGSRSPATTPAATAAPT